MTSDRLQYRLSVFGWLIYDFANTIFSMNILTMYFAQWIIVDLGYPDIYYSIAYSVSMVAVALTLPIIGLKSDVGGRKKKYLVIFSLSCICTTALLGTSVLVLEDVVVLAVVGLVCLAIANYFFEGGIVFYNALLPSVSRQENAGTISGLGVGIGYIGAIVGLLIVQPLTDGSISFLPSGRQMTFLPTAFLYLIFFIPTWVFLKEKRTQESAGTVRRSNIKGLISDLKEARKYKGAFRFLIANYFFEDAIATLIIFMAVFAQKVMNMPDSIKVTLFIVSTISAVIGSVIVGRVSDHFGHYRSLKAVVIGWIILFAGVSITTNITLFWIAGSAVGVLLGSTWALSRPILNSLVPESRLGMFYGLYAFSGKMAAIVGPLIWGLVVLWFTSAKLPGRITIDILDQIGITLSEPVLRSIEYRFAVLSLSILMLIGFLIYRKVPDRFARHRADAQ